MHIECQSERAGRQQIEQYTRPLELMKLLQCTQTSVTESMIKGLNKNNCTAEELQEFFSEIKKRLEKEDWCAHAIGLDLTVSKKCFCIKFTQLKCNSQKNTCFYSFFSGLANTISYLMERNLMPLIHHRSHYH